MMLNYFKKLWKGEEKLWKVFWLWGVGGEILIIILIKLLTALFKEDGVTNQIYYYYIGPSLFYLVMFIYPFLAISILTIAAFKKLSKFYFSLYIFIILIFSFFWVLLTKLGITSIFIFGK